MHPPQVRDQALTLVREGVNDCEVARRLGIPRTTIRDWRRAPALAGAVCPRCWRLAKPMRFSPEDYSELLGLYLGDGCISRSPRSHRLRITLDLKYPVIISDGHALLERCFPGNRVAIIRKGLKGHCANLTVYSEHLPCLFPQHGPGPKHRRRIELEGWQEELLRVAPFAFIRGCIRSDGCVFVNRTGPYEYLSYHFCNKSGDIVGLLTESCEQVGVQARATFDRRRQLWSVRINRRESVARLLETVGVKR